MTPLPVRLAGQYPLSNLEASRSRDRDPAMSVNKPPPIPGTGSHQRRSNSIFQSHISKRVSMFLVSSELHTGLIVAAIP